MRNADHRSQEAQHGRGPDDDAHQAVAVLLPRRVQIGHVFQVLVQPFGRPLPLDRLQHLPHAASQVRLADGGRLLVQLLDQRADVVDFLPGGGRLVQSDHVQGPVLQEHVNCLQSERRQPHEEQSRLDDQHGVRCEVAMDRRQVERPAIDQHIEDAAQRGAQQQRPAEMGEDGEKRIPVLVFRHRRIPFSDVFLC